MDITPFYRHSKAYAQEHGEMKEYTASHDAHVACKNAIEQAIERRYNNWCLPLNAAKDVFDQFGAERTLYVLAVSIRAQVNDERINEKIKNWAMSIPVIEDVDRYGRDCNADLIVEEELPSVLGLFTKMARSEFALTQPHYCSTYEIAQERGELDQYFVSRDADLLCRDIIEDSIERHWNGSHVAPEAAQEVLDRVNPEQAAYVLANTIQQKSRDKRFSQENREWAKTVPMIVPEVYRRHCIIETHSVKLNEFTTLVRLAMQERERPRERVDDQKHTPKLSIRLKLHEHAETPSVPKLTDKRKDRAQER